ncbi:uncharacterized protein LOC121467734 [Drosophila elegans]|uniref:uncharacterized protein LOC121467734 n=1 Tax=Drosophila elegans TaxID=30023 RepID=UPI001BC82FED|nr:uncharacterized protein LOC121467734 [Drosophila elegans]
MASTASGVKENLPLGCFLRASVSGAAMDAKFFMNRLYHPAVPRKLRNSFTFFGSGIFCIAKTLSGSICSFPPPMINPRHCATKRRYRRCVWKSGATTRRSSR